MKAKKEGKANPEGEADPEGEANPKGEAKDAATASAEAVLAEHGEDNVPDVKVAVGGYKSHAEFVQLYRVEEVPWQDLSDVVN